MAAGRPRCQPRRRLPTRHGLIGSLCAVTPILAPVLLLMCLCNASAAVSSPQLGRVVHDGPVRVQRDSGFKLAGQLSKQSTDRRTGVQRGDHQLASSSRRLLLAADVQPPQEAGQQALNTCAHG